MYAIETYTYPMTIELDGLGVFSYEPMTQEGTRLWLEYEYEKTTEYAERAHQLNSFLWYELNPFQRIIESMGLVIEEHQRDPARFDPEVMREVVALYHAFDLLGPEGTLCRFLRACQRFCTYMEFFDLDSPLWDDCHFFGGA